MTTRATKKRAARIKVITTNDTPEEKKPEMLKEEKINHPNHYQHDSGVECIAVAEKLGFNLGNAFKYMFRAGKKTGEAWLDDAKKARFYLVRWMNGDVSHAVSEFVAFDSDLRNALTELAGVEDSRIMSHAENLYILNDDSIVASALGTTIFGIFVNALFAFDEGNSIPISTFIELLNTKIVLIETYRMQPQPGE